MKRLILDALRISTRVRTYACTLRPAPRDICSALQKMSTLAQLLSYANTGAALSGAGMLALYITPYNFVVKQAALRFITESPLIRKVRACVCCMQFVLLACILALGGVGVGVGARSSVLRVCCCACGVVWWLYGVQLHVASVALICLLC